MLAAVVLRLWSLGKIPAGLTPDEASLGYNAYSILHTGRDEYGKVLPIIFKSFGDYKPGFYIYLTLPSVFIFGLSEFSVRLPSALLGIFAVYLIYLIGKKFFSEKIGLLTAFVAAFNPYLIYFSRGAWEANVSLFFTLLGILFFTKSKENNKYLIYSGLSFAATLITYQGAKLSTLVVVLLLTIIYLKDIKAFNKKYLWTSIILGLLVAVPVIATFFNGQAVRLKVFSVFSYQRPPEITEEILKQGNEEKGSLTFQLFHARSLDTFRGILTRYFNVFSGKFLFFEGDNANPIHTAPYQGILLISDILFLPLGLFAIIKKKLSKEEIFILAWMLLAPFSSALTRDQTNAVRSLNLAAPLVFVLSLGVEYVVSFAKSVKFKNLLYFILGIVYIVGISYFLDAYFVHVNAHNSNYWRYGYKEAVNFVLPNEGKYKNVVFEQSFNQPYIYFLFYGPKNPKKYQSEQKFVDSQYLGDVGFIQSYDNIQFQKIDWEVIKRLHDTLVVADPVSLPPDMFGNPQTYRVLKEIKYLNGRDTAFIIFEIK